MGHLLFVNLPISSFKTLAPTTTRPNKKLRQHVVKNYPCVLTQNPRNDSLHNFKLLYFKI